MIEDRSTAAGRCRTRAVVALIASLGAVGFLATGGCSLDDSGEDRSPSKVTATTASTSPSTTRLRARFDLQAHRGGAAVTTENSLAAFGRALDIGVTTLELDVQVTKDKHVIVSHDTRVNPDNCRDTTPATAGDPLYPYEGKPWVRLTLAQVKTLQCGHRAAQAFPQQTVVEAQVPELVDVFALVKERGADTVGVNVEIKFRAVEPEVTVTRDVYAERAWAVIEAAGMSHRVSIQSFDWESLSRVHAIAPDARLIALASPGQLQVAKPGASPWLAGVDIDDVGGNLVRAAQTIDGLSAISPRFSLPVDAAMVEQAHAVGLQVIPWTVDEPADMRRLVALGVDGVITNRPDVLRQVLEREGVAVPAAHPAR